MLRVVTVTGKIVVKVRHQQRTDTLPYRKKRIGAPSELNAATVQIIGRKLGSRKRFCIYSDSSSDHINEKTAANNSTGRKRSHNPGIWDQNVQKHNRIKDLGYRNRSGRLISQKTFANLPC
ncbi:hypothetical protein TNIN_261091 [Trichonephila inaurata madagascariensis]|uniref:Uncharacterized protein n=1 Tax=Trichonephila inaurata madagascariensis TaxID=2747483 RepID=A0A8X7CS06_9ARAC|nr:hypothetical protein TNIN_261091 [Trichonephila inaurata madagascariensis]